MKEYCVKVFSLRSRQMPTTHVTHQHASPFSYRASPFLFINVMRFSLEIFTKIKILHSQSVFNAHTNCSLRNCS